jgi:hypothetical protein
VIMTKSLRETKMLHSKYDNLPRNRSGRLRRMRQDGRMRDKGDVR